MTKGLPRSLSRGSAAAQTVSKLKISLKDAQVTVAAASTAVGFGTVVIGDFPEAQIKMIGAAAKLQFSGSGADDNLTADWEGDFSIGTTATADVTLDGTDVNIIASTAIPAATAEVSPEVNAINGTDAVFDNTDGSLEVNLNVLIDAADITDDESVVLTVDGIVEITYITLLDD